MHTHTKGTVIIHFLLCTGKLKNNVSAILVFQLAPKTQNMNVIYKFKNIFYCLVVYKDVKLSL